MKILMTGMTPRGVGSQRVAGDYSYLQLMMRDALTEMGHFVELRPLTWGEDLSFFDAAFVHFGILSSQSSYHFPSVAWALHQMPKRSVLYCDDWGVERTRGDYNRILNETYDRGMYAGMTKWDKYLKWRGDKMTTFSRQDTDLMRDTLRLIIQDPCPWPVAAPMFSWGDHSKLLRDVWRNVHLLPFDISSMVRIPDFNLPMTKKREWVLASLSDQTDWVKKKSLKWPVNYLGNAGKLQEAPMVSTQEVVRHYANCWGVLCPAYKTAGSGWWRDRFHLAAVTRSILLGDESECRPVGPNYYVSRYTVEDATDAELTVIADHQRDRVLSQLWSRARLKLKLNEIAANAAGGWW